MQLPPLEANGTPAGKTVPEEKQESGAGFSEILALALGAGLSLFGPEGKGGAESQESLMEALEGEEGGSREAEGADEADAVEEADEIRPRDVDAAGEETSEVAEEPAEDAAAASPRSAGEHSSAATPAAGMAIPGLPTTGGQPLESLASTLETEGVATTAPKARPAARSDLAARLTRVVQIMKQDGETLFRGTLRLARGELGRLRVDLEMKDDSLKVRFLVDSEEARQALESQMEELRESLRDQGFANLEIAVELGESSGEEARGSESPEPGPDEAAVEDTIPPRVESRWDGLLDLLA